MLMLLGLVSRSFSQIVVTPTIGCAPLSVNFSGPAGATNVYWNLGNGSSQLINPSNIYNTPGTFNITYTALVNGSPVNYSQQLIVNTGPTGNFSYVLPSSHCLPMTVNFTGTGGGPGSVFNWAFGDLASSLATTGVVTHTYTSAGSFVPLMTVVDAVTGCTAVAKAGTINVSSPPTVIIGSSNGFVGCTPPFTTNISGNASVGNSPNPGPLNFNWQFNVGNPAGSTAAVPGLVTFGSGQHTIALTVTDNNSCSNTGTTLVTAFNSSLTTHIQPTVCYNDYISATGMSSSGSVNWQFTGPSVNTTPVTPNTSFSVNNVYFAATPGLISYTASINPGGVCPGVISTGTFFVEKITPVMTTSPAPPISTCQSPFSFNLINLSTVNTSCTLSCAWEAFVSPLLNTDHITPTGTVVTTGSLSPTYTMTQGSLNPYTRYKNFAPLFKLILTSCNGCVAEIPPTSGFINQMRPTAAFYENVKEGCVPLTVRFRDTSYSPLSSITGYTFYHGAAPQFSVAGTNNPFPLNITYTASGIYYPYLKIETAAGCNDISFVDTIRVVNTPTVSGSVVTTSACAGNNVTINLSAQSSTVPGSTGVDHWHVETDNKFFSGCITNPNPTFPFTHVGTHTIGVSGYQRGCRSTAVLPQTIQIKGPYGKLRFETSCVGNKKDVKFAAYLQDVETATLSFGDGNSVTIPGSIGATFSYSTNHTYSVTGPYTVSLVSKNSLNTSCAIKTVTTLLNVIEPDANITFNGQAFPSLPNALACTKSRYNFSGATSVGASAGCGTGYVWDLKGPNFTMPTVESAQALFSKPFASNDTVIFNLATRDSFRVAGNYTISLRVHDENGCFDTETKVFRISDAEPSFTFNANPVCLSAGSVQVLNNTQANQMGNDAITGYTFSFGDNPPGILTSTSPTFNPVYSYAFAAPPSQSFQVKCIATNNLGCRDTATRVLKVNNPFPGLMPANYFLCLPAGQTKSTTFSAIGGYATYSVNFGDPPGSTNWVTSTSFSNVPHVYSAPGLYGTTLTVRDNGSCTATQIQTISVLGQPTANIVFQDHANRFCLPGIPTIISTSSINVSPITQYQWSMGGQTALGTATLTNILANTGVFTVNLTVAVDGVCQSSDTALVFVSDPLAKMTIDKRMFCLGETIKVSITDSSGVYAWKWFFGDNVPQKEIIAKSVLAQLTKTLSYPYTIYPDNGTNGKATVSLLYYAAGPTCLRSDTANITIIKLDGNFNQVQNIYQHCLDIPDTFTGQANNPYKLNLEYNWTFEGSKTATGTSATHNFSKPGINTVQMNVLAPDYGCTVTATKNLTIFPLPTANFSVKDTACPEEVFVIRGSGSPGVGGAINGTINPLAPGDTLRFMPDNTFSVNAHAPATTEYTLNVKDNNGCVSKTITDLLYVQQPAPIVHWDTTVIIGQTIPLNTYAGFGFTYTWTPLVLDLNCSTCLIYNPISTTTGNVTYSVMVEDGQHCSVVQRTYKINVLPLTSVDVPTAFTPNGDGINDIIYADGWGIRKLLFFKIFNRWGQLLFETNDLKTGWDGRFNGNLQNIETYVFQVSVVTYTNETISKSGTFKLLR